MRTQSATPLCCQFFVDESALTQAVIDSGKHKEMVYDPDRGLSQLRCGWISQSSCKQRAGRVSFILQTLLSCTCADTFLLERTNPKWLLLRYVH